MVSLVFAAAVHNCSGPRCSSNMPHNTGLKCSVTDDLFSSVFVFHFNVLHFMHPDYQELSDLVGGWMLFCLLGF